MGLHLPGYLQAPWVRSRAVLGHRGPAQAHPPETPLDDLCKRPLRKRVHFTQNRVSGYNGAWTLISGSMCSAEAEFRQMKSWGRRKGSSLVKQGENSPPLPAKAQDS